MNIDSQIILDELSIFQPIVVYLYGSMAKGNEHADSDMDLAFLPHAPCDAYQVFMAAQRIAVKFSRDVDLIDLSQVGDVLKVQVIDQGLRLYTGDELKAAEFEMYALSNYARLNEERKPVLEQLGVNSL